MKVLRILCAAAVCLLMALPINSVGYQTSLFVSPVPSLAWGTSREEIIEQRGLSEEVVSRGKKTDLWLTPEELGWDPAEHLGLTLYPDGSRKGGDIKLSFMDKEDLDSAWRHIEFNVAVPNIDYLLHRLERFYGRPVYLGDKRKSGSWICYQKTDMCTPEEMVYLGARYSFPRALLYPYLSIDSKYERDGMEIYKISFSGGAMNYPKDYLPDPEWYLP